jgi:peroxiredoxin
MTATSVAVAQQAPSALGQSGPRSAKPSAPEAATIGKPFKDFTLRDIASDKKTMVALSSFKGKKILVGIFMANRCGTTWTYEQKIGDMIKDYLPKDVKVVAIHANYVESDAEIMGQFEQRNLPIPVLDDKPTQGLAKYIGATCTPTFFVVDKEGVLRYIGAFDKYGRTPYIRPVLDAVIAGKQTPFTKTTAFG